MRVELLGSPDARELFVDPPLYLSLLGHVVSAPAPQQPAPEGLMITSSRTAEWSQIPFDPHPDAQLLVGDTDEDACIIV